MSLRYWLVESNGFKFRGVRDKGIGAWIWALVLGLLGVWDFNSPVWVVPLQLPEFHPALGEEVYASQDHKQENVREDVAGCGGKKS